MDLTEPQRAWADGADGEARALSMQLLIAAGEVWDAPRLRPIEVAYVNTTFSGSPSHLDLLETIAAGSGRVAVPTSTNIAGTALGDGRMGPQAEALARDTARLSALHAQIGARPTSFPPLLARVRILPALNPMRSAISIRCWACAPQNTAITSIWPLPSRASCQRRACTPMRAAPLL